MKKKSKLHLHYLYFTPILPNTPIFSFFGITLTPFNKMVLINGYNFMLNDEITIFFFSTLTQPHNILVPNPP